MKASSLRTKLFPLVPLYAGVIGAKQWLFATGLLRQRRLPCDVISVGSLSVGGAGKTPVVLMLGKLLQMRGFEPRILTRGYRRSSTEIERVDPAGQASRFGDEPLLLAQRLAPSSVYAGVDRHRAGMMAECDAPAQGEVVYVLDDGFQHRKLAREVDIVLLTRQELDDRLLPAGNLREPLSALRFADVLVVREDEPEVAEWVRMKFPEKRARTWVVRRELRVAPQTAMPGRPIVFCGLARPESFYSMLARNGIAPANLVTFHDHHPYSARDIKALLSAAKLNDADGFMTTEKDAIKLSVGMIEELGTIGPVAVPQLHVELIDEEVRIEELLSLLTVRHAQKPKDTHEKLGT